MNSKVMLANNQPIPTLLLANKVNSPTILVSYYVAVVVSLGLFAKLIDLICANFFFSMVNSAL